MSTKTPRRSTRLSSRASSMETVQPRRSSRLITKNPLLTITIDSDDEDVIYLAPPPPITIDLTSDLTTKHKSKTCSTFSENNEKVPVVKLTDLILTSPVKTIQTCPAKKESPFKDRKESPFKEPPSSPQKRNNNNQNQMVTPPKQRKIENEENIPITPPTTPSVLLERLSLIGSEEKNNRKKLFQENDLYQSARKALHSTVPSSMPGREKELSDLREFILEHLKNESSGSLYVSGPPGTGKTASLNLILQEEKISSKLKDVYVNCTSIKSSSSIFSRIAKDLGVKTSSKGEKDCTSAIERHLKRNLTPILLILDEIDQLESKNQSVLYTIFEWPSIPDSKLILIGIANALDLTDRTLPRLQARCELKPKLMHFAPYTKQQIVEIFTNRLRDAGVLDIFSPVALQMLAGKVAAISGDVRRALDIGRRVVELADRKKSGESVLKSMENLAEELDKVDDNGKKVKSVDLQEVMAVLNNVYGTSQNFNDDADDSFPLQQKIVVCSLLLILKKAKNKDVTVGRLHEIYRKVCSKRKIQVVDQGEFVGLCSLIETRGIFKIIKKKDPRMNKISLMWDEEEVAAALKDKQLMSTILHDVECLGKL